MTRDDAARLWPIIKAYSEGKTVQRMNYAEDRWVDAKLETDFLCVPSAYRIKPEHVACWVLVNCSGLVLGAYGHLEDARKQAHPHDRVIRMVEA